MPGHIVAGLDMGTAKICAVVAERNGRGIHVLGVGTAPASGMRKGMIINIDEAVQAIREAMKDAEKASGTRIRSVCTGISGSHMKGFFSSGATGIRGRDVGRRDIAQAIDSAKAVYIPLDREVLHVIPTEFVLDGQEGITNPSGMSGVRLEARVHIITGSVSAVQNLVKCCGRAGLDVQEIVVKPLASSVAVLSRDEREYGVVFVDIGGGTTDIAFFRENALRHLSVIGIGGAHLTSDLAIGLRIGLHEAEKLKLASGAACPGVVREQDEIRFSHAGEQERTLPRKYLVEILQPRCEEMLERIKGEIQACSGYELATCGVVLSGGVSVLSGFDTLAETVLGLPVRIGRPVAIPGLKEQEMSPAYATGIGLVVHALAESSGGSPYQEAVAGMMHRCRDAVRSATKYFTNFTIQNRKEEGGVVCLKSRK